MTIIHYSPADFSKGTTARTKQNLLNEVLNKRYNRLPSYKTPKGLTVNNFVPCVKDGEAVNTFTFRYGRKPVATFIYKGDMDNEEQKETFLQEVRDYCESTPAIEETLWAMFKATSITNGRNASGTSLQVA